MDRPETAAAATDPYDLRRQYLPLRVVDAVDAMDGIGYFNIGLMSREVRPLWAGMRFWGVAATLRCVPANRPMWRLNSTEEIVNAHGLWFRQVPSPGLPSPLPAGSVVVMDSGGGGEVGFWGSNNSLGLVAQGVVGIITDGYCRDTAELALQKTPVCARARGRTIIPGRIEAVEAQTRIACGGVQVCPGDMVGCDDDGIVVVPQRVAAEVAVHARAILLADMRGRRKLYERLAMPPDPTVDVSATEAYFRGLGGAAG